MTVYDSNIKTLQFHIINGFRQKIIYFNKKMPDKLFPSNGARAIVVCGPVTCIKVLMHF